MRKSKKLLALVMACTMIVTACPAGNSAMAAKSKKAVKSVKVTNVKKTVTLKKGASFKVKVKVTTKGGATKAVTFTSSNKKIASVSNKGVIKAKKKGTAKITVKSKFNKSKKVTFKVKVTERTVQNVIPDAVVPMGDTKYTEKDLVWKDSFNGTELNRNDWNVELHEPGWVNNESQKYVDSEDNIRVQNGFLTIQAKKDIANDGTVSYTSGRINTQNKHDYLYGRFESRLKVPKGNNFLPAFWMMPTDESLYGQWPRCGEIDIMEVLGSATNPDASKKLYSTLHFGAPHKEAQGTYVLDKGSFADEFHVFACEWEPGEIRFYVDGKLYHTENNWFTKKDDGYGEVTYPAPYDQPFHVILNLAVGGNWAGAPDETKEFGKDAQMVVDYVKIYQKDSYNENVKKPEVKDDTFREPDATGNYIINGDFADATDISIGEGKNWEFHTAGTGVGSADIKDNTLNINTKTAGDLDYSIQVFQPNVPVYQGYKYKVSFDAYADEARTMITNISAPNNGWIRYFEDTKVDLTTEKQHYEFTFDMKKKDDAACHFEFDFGNQGSTAAVHVSNVRLEKIGEFEIEKPNYLPDGNYVYNGEFQEGENRLDYWTVENSVDAKVSVTNKNNVRELKAEVHEGVSGLESVVVKQKVKVSAGKKYVLVFDAYGAEEKTVQTKIAGNSFDVKLKKEKQTFKYKFETAESVDGSELAFLLGVSGTTYLDNVRIQEDALLLNGDFSSGDTGYELYVNAPASATGLVDSITENYAYCTNIESTGNTDWFIQLKQTGITLEKGKWYRFGFKAKSTVNRKILYALQKDGSNDNDWKTYSGNGSTVVDITDKYTKFSVPFQMNFDTDNNVIMSISMGAVEGVQIDTPHTVTIDDIFLEEISEDEALNGSDQNTPSEDSILKNVTLTNDGEGWEKLILDPAKGDYKIVGNKITYSISDVGTDDWNIQLKQGDLKLEKGETYRLTFKASSTVERTIKTAFMSLAYDWYGGEEFVITDKETEYSYEFTMNGDTNPQSTFQFSLGKVGDAAASTITISDISFVKIS